MLSTKAGLPIAKIVHNKKYSSINLVLDSDKELHERIYDGNEEIDVFDFINEDELERYFHSKAGFKRDKFVVPKELLDKAKVRSETEFMIREGSLEPMPNLRNERDVLYVAGPSGAGKSTYIGNYMKNYHRTFPDNRIVVISKVASDKAFDRFNPIRIEINEENLINNPINVSEFRDCLVVFDDIDTITDEVLVKAARKLRDDCMEIGRHDKVSVAATSHLLMNYKLTRGMINEAQTVTFYPRSGSTYQIQNFLKQYGGLTKDQIHKVINLPSRWVTLHKNYPCYIFHEKGAYLIGAPDTELRRKMKNKTK